MGGWGAQRPVMCDNELKKTGARSARARTRGQNPLVDYKLVRGANMGTYGYTVYPMYYYAKGFY